MKKLTLYLLMMAMGLFVYSQKVDKSQVPEAVKKMFQVKTNDTLTPVWEKSGEIYTASFTKGELKAQVIIGSKADWQKTIWDMPYQYVPQKIKDNVLKNYAGFKVVKTTIQYRTDGDFYVLETKKKKVSQTLDYDLKGEFKKVEQPVEVKTDVKTDVKKDAKTDVKKEEKK
jgi:hypothetical protein